MSNRHQTQQDSLFEDPSTCGSPSIDSIHHASTHLGISKLYEQIGVPHSLPEETNGDYGDLKTAYQLNFTKLPLNLYSANDNPQDNDKSEENKTSLPTTRKNINSSFKPNSPISVQGSQNMFQLYSRQDQKLVYLKYKNQGGIETKQNFYASYYINIPNLLRNKYPKVQFKNKESDSFRPEIPYRNDCLHFNSLFESGNLYAASKVSENEYDLILQNDINSKGHTQWFFFSVGNTVKGKTVKFNIVNLLKSESLFNEGMKPAVFSVLENALKGGEWKRAGSNISYYKNNIVWEGASAKPYYTLTFTYTFQHENDTVYFAHSFPYTYSDLKLFLNRMMADPKRKAYKLIQKHSITSYRYIIRRSLCQTLAKNECEYLSVTSPLDIQTMDYRYGIIITARQHPGESISSYMMEGFIDFITSEKPEAQFLREKCIFKIVPMLNPDGVIHGNYRSSLCGQDLNRIWNKPSSSFHPTIHYTKEMIKRVHQKRSIQLICDLHGHSRKKNAFFYGNAPDDNPYQARMIPLILSRMSKYVSFEDCRFVIQKSKENTARVALWRELNIPNVFTLEASFYGYQHKGNTFNFTREDFRTLGADLGRAVHVYIRQIIKERPDLLSQKVEPILEPPFDYQELVDELKTNKKLIEVGNQNDDSGSDTDNSEDDIPLKELTKLFTVPETPFPGSNKLVKKKSFENVKKSSSMTPIKKEDKHTIADMNEAFSPKHEKAKPDVTQVLSNRTKKLRKVIQMAQAPLVKGRFFAEDESQPQPEAQSLAQPKVEMASKGVQTEPEELEQMSEIVPIKASNESKPQKQTRAKQASLNISETGGLCIVGEKAGLDVNNAVDSAYILGKNQVTRAVSANINTAPPQRELSKTYSGHFTYKNTGENSSSLDQANEKKFKGGGLKAGIPAKGVPIIDELRLYCKTDTSNMSPVKEGRDLSERRNSSSQKQFHHRRLINANQFANQRFISGQKITGRNGLSPPPKQNNETSNLIKTEPKESFQAEAMLGHIYSRKSTNVSDQMDNSGHKPPKIPRILPQYLPSPNISSDKKGYLDKKKSTVIVPRGLLGGPGKLSEPIVIYRTKDQDVTPPFKNNSIKPIFMGEYRAEIEQKIIEMGLLKPKHERKSHNERLARKI